MSVCVMVLMGCLLAAVTEGQVTIIPVQIRGRLGENVDITCVVGEVEPSFAQLRTTNEVQLSTNSQDVQSDRVVFNYGPLTQEDDGRLVICHFGEEEARGTISVLFPPIFSVTEQEYTLPEGADVMVTLNVSGNPLPTDQDTTWTFSGGSLGAAVRVSSNSLLISSVGRDHAGVYTVQAVTSAGTGDPLSITINVLYPPMFTTDEAVGVVCSGASFSDMCAVRVGGSGSLSCNAVGFPTPTYTITSSSRRITQESGGTVGLASLTPVDSGANVSCTASNSLDTISRTFTIYVGSSPAQPIGVNANVEGGRVVVVWEYIDPQNNVPLSRFMLRVNRTDGGVVSTATSPPSILSLSIPLSSLAEGTRYNVEVWSENLLGSSESAGTQFTTPITRMEGGSLMLVAPWLSVLLTVNLTILFS